ncbi:MAG: tetratricopeptide repeat protein [Magnetococcales bacterium]|nr:tetratricopeptide repeat protein [Magnetococcales bacterium]
MPTPSINIQQLINLAVHHHQSGALPQAQRLYRQVLEHTPNHSDALHLLGVIAQQQGHLTEAEPLIRKALLANPNLPEAHNNLGTTLRDLGRLEEAIASYQRAVALNPDMITAHLMMAGVHLQLNQKSEGIASLQAVLALQPNHVDALNNLGNVLTELERYDEAIALYDRAVAIQPNYANVHYNRGNTLRLQKRFDEAIAGYERALELNPALSQALNNIGHAHLQQKHFTEAVPIFQRVLQVRPDDPGPLNSLGHALTELGALDEAIPVLERAIAADPTYPEAHSSLGNALKRVGRLKEAVESYARALTLGSSYAMVKNLVNALLYVPDMSPDARYELTARHMAACLPPGDPPPRPEVPLAPGERLRIGYLSSDFRNHPVGHNIYPLLSSHNHEKFEIFAYAELAKEDQHTRKIKQHMDHWRPTRGLTDDQVADMVREDRIHIMVYLAGLFDENRILVAARRPAPVQVSFHNGASTTLETMDYWLTDSVIHPPGETVERFSETLWRLPVFYSYPPLEGAPDVGPLPADRNGFITFGSFNNPTKITPPVVALWADILKAVPDARLILKYHKQFKVQALADRFRELFREQGIDPARLTILGDNDNRFDHLNHYNQVDIALDPFPFTGATTTFQALWMGVPVVSLMGDGFIGRMAGDILVHTGLPELTVHSEEAYLEVVLELVGDLERMRELREGLREGIIASDICDFVGFTRGVEEGFVGMLAFHGEETFGVND